MAQLSKGASRAVVADALKMLARMSHRGACGCEENTGKITAIRHDHCNLASSSSSYTGQPGLPSKQHQHTPRLVSALHWQTVGLRLCQHLQH